MELKSLASPVIVAAAVGMSCCVAAQAQDASRIQAPGAARPLRSTPPAEANRPAAAVAPAPATQSEQPHPPQWSATPRVDGPESTQGLAPRRSTVLVVMPTSIITPSMDNVSAKRMHLPPQFKTNTTPQLVSLPSVTSRRGNIDRFSRHPVTAASSARAMTPVSRPAPSGDALLLQQLDAALQRREERLQDVHTEQTRSAQRLAEFTGTLRAAMLEAGPDATGLHPFVRVALRYAGTPYVWGGESARGFDCSGFIIRVMRDLGYHALPHSAAEQYTYGKPIAQQLLKPGDIVFFKNTYKPGVSHVGIYLGKRRFIQAAGTGKGTIVSSLDDAHYVEHYAGARRLIPAR